MGSPDALTPCHVRRPRPEPLEDGVLLILCALLCSAEHVISHGLTRIGDGCAFHQICCYLQQSISRQGCATLRISKKP